MSEPPSSSRPISSDSVAWTDFAEVPAFGFRYRHLTRAVLGGDYRVGVAIEELAPGHRSVPAHYHVFEEEHVYILEGALTLRLGSQAFPMQAGDYACFPAGRRSAHCFFNDGTEPCRYVIIGERNPNEIVVYPDSNKVLVRALGRRAIFDMASVQGYWAGEDTGAPDAAQPRQRDLVAEATDPPVAPICSADVAWNEEGDGGPRFGGRSAHLTWAALGNGDYRVGVLIEAPAPGMRLCPKHYHLMEEEHALILEGEVTLLLGDERIVMRPGDYVCFPAGRTMGHSFLNSGTGPCRYLMIGERHPADVCVYPDTGKVLVRALGLAERPLDLRARRDYWEGE